MYLTSSSYHRLFLKLLGHTAQVLSTNSDFNLASSVMNRLIKNHKNIKAVADFHQIKTLFILQPVQVIDYNLKRSITLSQNEYDRYLHLQFIRFGYEYLRSKKYSDNYNNEDFLDLSGLQKNEEKNLYVDPAHYSPYFSKKIVVKLTELLKTSPTFPPFIFLFFFVPLGLLFEILFEIFFLESFISGLTDDFFFKDFLFCFKEFFLTL